MRGELYNNDEMKLDFLKDVTVSAAPKVAPKRDTSKKVRVPQGLAIRLFKDGSVYPSPELTALFNLEFGPRDADKVPSNNGLDVIDSRDMTNQISTPTAFVGVSPNARALGKLDLFASSKYDENDNPTATVNTQGANSYGQESLIPLLEQVYGDAFSFNEEGFVDLVVITDTPIASPDNRYFFYKKITRGADAGKKSYVIRDNTVVYPLIPATAFDNNVPDSASIATDAGNVNGGDVAATKGSGKGVTA